jgi:hypothetical protein
MLPFRQELEPWALNAWKSFGSYYWVVWKRKPFSYGRNKEFTRRFLHKLFDSKELSQ